MRTHIRWMLGKSSNFINFYGIVVGNMLSNPLIEFIEIVKGFSMVTDTLFTGIGGSG